MIKKVTYKFNDKSIGKYHPLKMTAFIEQFQMLDYD